MSVEMTPLRIVSTAEEPIGIRDGGDAGLWPRTAAVLGARLVTNIRPQSIAVRFQTE